MSVMPPPKPPLGSDMVLLPKHYSRYQIEPVHFIGTNALTFNQGNIVKYTLRAPFKHADKGREDMLKVIRYAFMEAKRLLGDPKWAGLYRQPDLQRMIEEELTYDASRPPF